MLLPPDAPHPTFPRAGSLWLLVALGGTLGAAARETVGLLLPSLHGLPLGVGLVNLLGALILGLLYESLTRPTLSPDRAARLKLLLGTGFCGGFTTYSTLALDTVLLAGDGRLWIATGYVLGTVLVGAGATWLGIVLGARRNARVAAPGNNA